MPRNPALPRGEYQPETTSVVTWLMCAIVGALGLQFFAESAFVPRGAELSNGLALTSSTLSSGRVWPLLTFWLLHSTSNLFHAGLVLIGIFLLGRELVPQWGPRKFLTAFALSLGLGALTWSATHWNTSGTLVGSTAGVLGLVTLFALHQPKREIRVLVFFFFPVSFRSYQMAFGFLFADLLALLLIEVLQSPFPFDYAPSAHLGGMLAGWICFRVFTNQTTAYDSLAPPPHFDSNLPAPDRLGSPSAAGGEAAPRPGHTEVRRQLDLILDKINNEGMSALTTEERRLLDNAKELLNRR